MDVNISLQLKENSVLSETEGAFEELTQQVSQLKVCNWFGDCYQCFIEKGRPATPSPKNDFELQSQDVVCTLEK